MANREHRRAARSRAMEETRQAAIAAGLSPEDVEDLVQQTYNYLRDQMKPDWRRKVEANLARTGGVQAQAAAGIGVIAQGFPGIGTIIGAGFLAAAASLKYGEAKGQEAREELRHARSQLAALAELAAQGGIASNSTLTDTAAIIGDSSYGDVDPSALRELAAHLGKLDWYLKAQENGRVFDQGDIIQINEILVDIEELSGYKTDDFTDLLTVGPQQMAEDILERNEPPLDSSVIVAGVPQAAMNEDNPPPGLIIRLVAWAKNKWKEITLPDPAVTQGVEDVAPVRSEEQDQRTAGIIPVTSQTSAPIAVGNTSLMAQALSQVQKG